MITNAEYVYVHLPFCDVICHYCDFYTARAKTARHADLFSALEIEAQMILPQIAPKLRALYFGGGTPGVSPPELIDKFLAIFKNHLASETEITLEANPTNINPATVESWKKSGINRISLGIQSLDDQILKKIGRAHSSNKAREALSICLSQIDNVSGDLIYGVPGQSAEQPSEHALELSLLGVKHFSAYHLTLPEKHFLFSKLPSDTVAWEQIRNVKELLAPRGFQHYETSNFAHPGYESKNNMNYWTGGAYLALGPSAHGFDGKETRWRNIADWEKYILLLKQGLSPIEEKEELTREQRKIEVIFTSLRISNGLNLEAFQQKFGSDLRRSHASFFENWKKMGLGKVTNGHFVLSFEGRMLADEIAKKLV